LKYSNSASRERRRSLSSVHLIAAISNNATVLSLEKMKTKLIEG
jgi:hypothetical protein